MSEHQQCVAIANDTAPVPGGVTGGTGLPSLRSNPMSNAAEGDNGRSRRTSPCGAAGWRLIVVITTAVVVTAALPVVTVIGLAAVPTIARITTTILLACQLGVRGQPVTLGQLPTHGKQTLRESAVPCCWAG